LRVAERLTLLQPGIELIRLFAHQLAQGDESAKVVVFDGDKLSPRRSEGLDHLLRSLARRQWITAKHK
jgi:hypothetical protein